MAAFYVKLPQIPNKSLIVRVLKIINSMDFKHKNFAFQYNKVPKHVWYGSRDMWCRSNIQSKLLFRQSTLRPKRNISPSKVYKTALYDRWCCLFGLSKYFPFGLRHTVPGIAKQTKTNTPDHTFIQTLIMLLISIVHM